MRDLRARCPVIPFPVARVAASAYTWHGVCRPATIGGTDCGALPMVTHSKELDAAIRAMLGFTD